MKKILILSFSFVARDPRVMRQIRLLEADYDLTVVGFGSSPVGNFEFFSLNQAVRGWVDKVLAALKLFFGMFEYYYWGLPYVREAFRNISLREFDVVIANDILALPVSLSLARGSPVVIDAHEYSPREFDEKAWWRLLFGRFNNHLCKKYLPSASSMFTVCQGIADEYSRVYGVSCNVLHNAPCYGGLSPSQVDGDKIRLIHHGASMRARHLENMIEMMAYLDERFTLDFMLLETDSAYMQFLRDKAAPDNRIRFIPPVDMSLICSAINGYDVGIYLLPPINFNHGFALPNKFFEFVQACLAVAIGPSPEMAKLIFENGCGVVANSFDPKVLADELSALNRDKVIDLKAAAKRAAETLNFEHGSKKFLSEIKRLHR